MKYCEVIRDLAQKDRGLDLVRRTVPLFTANRPGEIPLGSNSLGVVDTSVQ